MMLNQTRSFVCAAALSAFLIAGTTANAAPPGAAITYQGQLTYLDIPVTTTADLRFRLYDEAGVQLGDEIRVEGVDLIEGEFEAVLDFGLANAAGWIEVDVRSPSGDGEYVTLSPRQRVGTLAPVFGEGTALNADGASAPEGASGGRELISLRRGAGGSDDDGVGGAAAAGAGQGTRPSQGVDAGGGSRGAGWMMAGSTVFYNGGNVGIGTNAPDAGLHVTGSGDRTAHIENTQVAGGNFGLQVEAGGATSRAIFARANRTVGQNYGVFGQSLSSRGTGVFGQAQSTFGINYGVTGVSRSASGTGVRGLATNPTGSTVGVYGEVNSPDGIAVRGVATNLVGGTTGVLGDASSSVLGDGVVGVGGAAGVGVKGTGSWGVIATGAVRGIRATGILGVDAQGSGIAGVLGECTSDSGSGVHGVNNTGAAGSVGVRGVATGSGWSGYFDGGEGVYVRGSGGVGADLSDLRLSQSEATLVVDGEDATIEVLSDDQGSIGSVITLKEFQTDGDYVNHWSIGRRTTPADGLFFVTYEAAPDTAGTISSAFTLLPNGNAGIGRVATVNALEVEGGASKTSAGDWSANSDRRIKTDVQTVTDALDTLGRVRLVSFEYTDHYKAAHPSVADRRYLNVIAQEFAEVFPEHVKGSGEYLPDGSEILQVDTYPLTIYSAAAIQELRALSERQAGEIAKQKRRVQDMEDRLQLLETLLLEGTP